MAGRGTLIENFGGRDRYLFYTARGWSAVGEKLGISVRLGHFREDLFEVPLPLASLHVLLWGGLLADDPELTVEQVADCLDEENVADLAALFFERYGGMSAPPMPLDEALPEDAGEALAAAAGAMG